MEINNQLQLYAILVLRAQLYYEQEIIAQDIKNKDYSFENDNNNMMAQ